MNENELFHLIMGVLLGGIGVSLVWGTILFRLLAPLLPNPQVSNR